MAMLLLCNEAKKKILVLNNCSGGPEKYAFPLLTEQIFFCDNISFLIDEYSNHIFYTQTTFSTRELF